MSLLSELRPMKKSTFRKKRIGRGNSSGWGTTAARGYNGQKSRSGSSSRATFEGGQMPLWQRLPKFGFTPISKIKFQIVSLDKVADLPVAGLKSNGDIYKITPSILKALRLIRKQNQPIKILKGKSELKRAFHIEADAFSLAAESIIKDAGGVAIRRVVKKIKGKEEKKDR